MKHSAPRHKAPAIWKRPLSLALCLLLAIAFYAPPALADDSQGNVPPETNASAQEPFSQPAEEATKLEEPTKTEEPVEPEEPAEPEGSMEAGNTQEPQVLAPSTSEENEESPEDDKVCTLTFRMGSFGNKTVNLEKGDYPSDIPDIPELPQAQVIGWFNEQGDLDDPGSQPVSRDAVYTARWARNAWDLLNAADHSAYIQGYKNGTFKPQASISRAEAAQLFYNLLLDKSVEIKSFSDVPSDKWYAAPVGAMATLGILQGYENGDFQPNRNITRAEFVKMAVSFDTISVSSSAFSDVPAGSWAAPYIGTAVEKGWVNGYEDGTFQPAGAITRAEAVTILNKVLGRVPEEGIKTKPEVKNFYDVFPSSWAYGNIVEASTNHSYSSSDAGEVWTDYEHDTRVLTSGMWYKDGGKLYYLDAKTKKFLRGKQTVNGKEYLFDSSTGEAVTGFRMVGSWRRYYKNGTIQKDISGYKVVSGPYFIKVYKSSNYLIIFAKDEKGNYNTPVRAMRVSCGYGTPCGTFYTPSRYRWLCMVGDTYAQWCTQISGNYLFHSVPNWTYSNMDLEVEEYNHLGDTRSMGCIRLNCRDAKWIYDNCVLGTKVFISATETTGPLAKPAGLQIPSWHTWDPTDPTANWKCKQKGCH